MSDTNINEFMLIPRDVMDEMLILFKKATNMYPTTETECNGYKCREPWCRSCYPEEDVNDFLEQAIEEYKQMKNLIKKHEDGCFSKIFTRECF